VGGRNGMGDRFALPGGKARLLPADEDNVEPNRFFGLKGEEEIGAVMTA
jgi:hypothetical protein